MVLVSQVLSPQERTANRSTRRTSSKQAIAKLHMSGHEIRSVVSTTVHELLELGDGDDGDDENQALDTHTPLMELGLDSLAATQLVRELSTKLQVELSPMLLFDHPTVDAISEHLVELLNSNVDDQTLHHTATESPPKPSVPTLEISRSVKGNLLQQAHVCCTL